MQTCSSETQIVSYSRRRHQPVMRELHRLRVFRATKGCQRIAQETTSPLTKTSVCGKAQFALCLLVIKLVILNSIPIALGRSSQQFISRMRSIPLAFSAKLPEQRLVLVGGGHAHVQVIKALNHASRPKHLKVTLIDVQRSASYSGMVPGAIAGIYSAEESLLHLEPLARWAGVDFIPRRVVDIDIDNKVVYLDPGDQSSNDENGVDSISFDAISIDIGSASRGFQDTAGAKEFAIATRPISNLVSSIEYITTKLQNYQQLLPDTSLPGETIRLVVIGGGTAGLELSMSVHGRWKPLLKNIEANLGKAPSLDITVLDSGDEVLPGESLLNRQALKHAIKEREITVKHGCEVSQICEEYIQLQNGDQIPYTHCIWATGAGPHDLAFRLKQRGLAVSPRGWIQVNPQLQSLSHPHIFAAGDCCTIEGLDGSRPSPPKAGVYAVRAGPILINNLTRFLEKSINPARADVQLETYKPQEDFLKLVVCGGGMALGFRFGIPMYGKWVFDLKHAIDTNFMNLFREELLPDLKAGKTAYDTSQYDDEAKPSFKNISVDEGARILQRSDDQVDFLQAWSVLRAMDEDIDYRQGVLREIQAAQETVPVS